MKKYVCFLLVFALVLFMGTTVFAEQELVNSGRDIVTEVDEAASVEDYESSPEMTNNHDVTKDNEENKVSGILTSEGSNTEEQDGEDTVSEMQDPIIPDDEGIAISTDIEITHESSEENSDNPDGEDVNVITPPGIEIDSEKLEEAIETLEENPMLIAAPPKNSEEDGTGEEHVITVLWEIEDAAIDICSSSYVWNTETLQYEKQSNENNTLGSRRTVGTYITITNQYGCATNYSIVYTPDSSVLENSETSFGESESSGRIENGESHIYAGIVTVTDVIDRDSLVDGAIITLGTYSVTISSAESS